VSINQEILLLLIGAAIGFVSSIATTIINKKLDKSGALKLYYKIVNRKNSLETWGFIDSNEGIMFQVPLWLEIHNTSNVTKIIRNFNLVLFNNDSPLVKMIQINSQVVNKETTEWYGDKGTYSFVLEPLSIKKFDLLFVIKQRDLESPFEFDEVRISYFDGKDKEHIRKLTKINNAWRTESLPRDHEWKLLK